MGSVDNRRPIRNAVGSFDKLKHCHNHEQATIKMDFHRHVNGRSLCHMVNSSW